MTGSNAGLEERVVPSAVDRSISMFVRGAALKLIAEGDQSNKMGLLKIIEAEYARARRDGETSNIPNMPQYAYAIEAMLSKACELAQQFLTDYRQHVQNQGVLRLLKFPLTQIVTSVGCGLLFFEIIYLASGSKAAEPAGLAGLAIGYVANKFLIKLCEREANQERRRFEEAVKAEFYRIARGA